MCLEITLKYKVKQSKNGKFSSNYKPAQLILKCIFPSVHKPFEYKPLQKGPLKNISCGAYFRNIMVSCSSVLLIYFVSFHSEILAAMLLFKSECYNKVYLIYLKPKVG